MKLAGITWWRNNYGSVLQAYALQEALNSYENVEYEIINQFGKRIVSVDNVLDKLKSIGIKKTFQRAFWKVGMPGLSRRSRKIQLFVDNYLQISAGQYTEETVVETNKIYDAFVCGSDQIWNPTLIELDSMYWLGFSTAGRKRIAYAPSIGVNSVADETVQQIKKNLARFDAISCREETGSKLLNSIMGVECCTTVLDPTLLVNREIWNNFSEKRLFENEYVFAYMLRGDKEQRRLIEDFARKNELKIVTIPFLETEYTEWYDLKFGDIKFWDAAPDEFVAVIRHAKFVFTDSFHSMVFSILYHIPFFTFPKVGKAQMNRIIGLQEMLEMESRMVNSKEDIERVQKKSIDWQKVDTILETKRQVSKEYLENALFG